MLNKKNKKNKSNLMENFFYTSVEILNKIEMNMKYIIKIKSLDYSKYSDKNQNNISLDSNCYMSLLVTVHRVKTDILASLYELKNIDEILNVFTKKYSIISDINESIILDFKNKINKNIENLNFHLENDCYEFNEEIYRDSYLIYLKDVNCFFINYEEISKILYDTINLNDYDFPNIVFKKKNNLYYVVKKLHYYLDPDIGNYFNYRTTIIEKSLSSNNLKFSDYIENKLYIF